MPAPVTTLYDRTNENTLKASWAQNPEDQSIRQRLLKELTDQQRIAKELVDLQGPQLTFCVFGRTDLDIAAEIDLLGIRPTPNASEGECAHAPIIEPDPAVVAPPVFSHSESYDSITFHGENYTLLERQAAVVRMLHNALKKGRPAVSTRTLLSVPGCEDITAVRDIFKSRQQLWGTLITNCEGTHKGRGFYRLHPSIKT